MEKICRSAEFSREIYNVPQSAIRSSSLQIVAETKLGFNSNFKLLNNDARPNRGVGHAISIQKSHLKNKNGLLKPKR